MQKTTQQDGFTLIETLIAIAILTIGIFSLYSMQIAAINGNGHANQLTSSANWASDRIERILGADYTNSLLADADGDGVAGLNDTVNAAGVVTADILVTQNAAGNDVITSNGAAVPANNSIPYSIFYNVAVDAVTPNTLTIRVITTWNNKGQQKSTVVDYVKPRVE